MVRRCFCFCILTQPSDRGIREHILRVCTWAEFMETFLIFWTTYTSILLFGNVLLLAGDLRASDQSFA